MNDRTKIYLDIDGVLLANENHAANHADEFLQFAINNFPVYWLTTHCHGNANVPLKRFRHLFEPETRELLPQIRPTDWHEAKTEAIDFSKPFLWFDDDLFPEERHALEEHNALASWIEVDLYKNPDALCKMITLLDSEHSLTHR